MKARILISGQRFRLLRLLTSLRRKHNMTTRTRRITARTIRILSVPLIRNTIRRIIFRNISFTVSHFARQLMILSRRIRRNMRRRIFTVLRRRQTHLTTLTRVNVENQITITTNSSMTQTNRSINLSRLRRTILTRQQMNRSRRHIARNLRLKPTIFFRNIFGNRFIRIRLTLRINRLRNAQLFGTSPSRIPKLYHPNHTFVRNSVNSFLTNTMSHNHGSSARSYSSLLLSR